MSAASNYLENVLLDHVLRNTTYTSPTTVYLALYTVTPSDAGGGTEVGSGVGYTRQAITFGAAAAGSITNTNAPQYGPCTTTAWGTIVAVGVFDASTAGNLLIWGPLTVSKTIAVSDEFKVPIGGQVITLD